MPSGKLFENEHRSQVESWGDSITAQTVYGECHLRGV